MFTFIYTRILLFFLERESNFEIQAFHTLIDKHLLMLRRADEPAKLMHDAEEDLNISTYTKNRKLAFALLYLAELVVVLSFVFLVPWKKIKGQSLFDFSLYGNNLYFLSAALGVALLLLVFGTIKLIQVETTTRKENWLLILDKIGLESTNYENRIARRNWKRQINRIIERHINQKKPPTE